MALPFLVLLPNPSRLSELKIWIDEDEGELESDEEAAEIGGVVVEDQQPALSPTAETLSPTPPVRTISAFLSLCTNLRSLTISGKFDYFSEPAVLPTLHRLPHLAHLTIGNDVEVSYKVLKSLITGEERLHHLKHLTFEMFCPPIGGYDADDCDGKPWRFEESWSRFLSMKWPRGLSLERLASFSALALDAGVSLDGMVLDALETWDNYEEVKRDLNSLGGGGIAEASRGEGMRTSRKG